MAPVRLESVRFRRRTDTVKPHILRYALLLWVLLAVWNLSVGAREAPERRITPERIHILAIGCCVPWLDASFCGKTTKEFVSALVEKLGVPNENVRLVLDKQATYHVVEDGFHWLAERTGEKDTAIIFYLGHGRQLKDVEGDEKDGLDEVLWLWSEKMPKSQWYAVNNKIWMKDDDFSALVLRVTAGRKIVIVDSCRAGTMIEPTPHSGDKTKIAVITGAADGVDSKMVPEKRDSVFIRAFIEAIRAGAASFEESFEIAKQRTTRETEAICRERKRKSPDKECETQIPQITDPHGICRSLRLSP